MISVSLTFWWPSKLSTGLNSLGRMKTSTFLLMICVSLASEVYSRTPSVGSGGGSFGLHFFEKIQDIPTKGGNAADSFEINGTLYLVVANRYSGTRSSRTAQTNSVIYKLQGNSFVIFQTIPTNKASGLDHVIIDGYVYLSIANQKSGTSIYKWNGASFVLFQTIIGPSTLETKFFSFCEETYLVVGRYRSTNSFIYKWQNNHFVQIQAIATQGFHGVTIFHTNGKMYLAVASNFISGGVKAPSVVYKWVNNRFVAIQYLPSSYSHRIHSFKVNGHTFLARTNYLNNRSPNTDSIINKWNGKAFSKFQAIQTRGAVSFQSLVINGETYLTVANARDARTGQKTNSVIYKATGAQFTKYQELSTVGAFELHPFSYKGEIYIIVLNFWDGNTYNVNSEIYKWV